MFLHGTRCGHWIGTERRYCHHPGGVRPYLQGPRCPAHTPNALAGRPEPPSTSLNEPERSAMPDTSPLVAAALTYARRGWPVFMLARSKRPVANCQPCADAGPDHDREGCVCLTCHGFYAASTDPARVAAIVAAVPRGQLAMRTGAASGTVVVDVDPRHGGHNSMAALIAEGLLPRTRYAATGSDGLHLYYRHPGISVISRPMPGRHGIDIKADGGYVVLPPSRHQRTGRPYRWADGEHDLIEMAPALLDACQATPTRTVSDTTRSTRTPGEGPSHPLTRCSPPSWPPSPPPPRDATA